MAVRRRLTDRSRWLALVAACGMLWAAGDTRCRADACCPEGAASCDDCCAPRTSGQGYQAKPCECRSAEPVAPAPKPDKVAADAAHGLPVQGPAFDHAAPAKVSAISGAASYLTLALDFLTTHLRC